VDKVETGAFNFLVLLLKYVKLLCLDER